MTHPRESRPHPGEGEERLSVSGGNLDKSQSTAVRPRCLLYGHVVFTRVSILTGLGRDCRRDAIRNLRAVVA